MLRSPLVLLLLLLGMRRMLVLSMLREHRPRPLRLRLRLRKAVHPALQPRRRRRLTRKRHRILHRDDLRLLLACVRVRMRRGHLHLGVLLLLLLLLCVVSLGIIPHLVLSLSLRLRPLHHPAHTRTHARLPQRRRQPPRRAHPVLPGPHTDTHTRIPRALLLLLLLVLLLPLLLPFALPLPLPLALRKRLREPALVLLPVQLPVFMDARVGRMGRRGRRQVMLLLLLLLSAHNPMLPLQRLRREHINTTQAAHIELDHRRQRLRPAPAPAERTQDAQRLGRKRGIRCCAHRSLKHAHRAAYALPRAGGDDEPGVSRRRPRAHHARVEERAQRRGEQERDGGPGVCACQCQRPTREHHPVRRVHGAAHHRLRGCVPIHQPNPHPQHRPVRKQLHLRRPPLPLLLASLLAPAERRRVHRHRIEIGRPHAVAVARSVRGRSSSGELPLCPRTHRPLRPTRALHPARRVAVVVDAM
ncbi:hypothetical protein K438DRAFT_1844559 [Mycena galopus ATCC 62051]|nr:hypothetical protein K438DRAFT_1844559 [Mycena galopus ATCC 62051]